MNFSAEPPATVGAPMAPVTELGGGREVMPSQIKLRNTARIAMEW